MKQTKAAGTRRENAVKAILDSQGWVTMRAPASIGAADLIALKIGHAPRFVQVKANRDGGPYNSFGPADRLELMRVARQAGGVAELCWWPPRGEIRWIPSSQWPLPTPVAVAA